MYNSLHNHFEKGSPGDSILKVKDGVETAKKLGMTALAITDHGSMAQVVEFYKHCVKNNIKPILGMEAYEVQDRTERVQGYNHLVLLARNHDGYKDLLKIAEDFQKNGFYYKPRTDLSVLKKYGKNIIATSACIQGHIPQMLKALIEEEDDSKIDEMFLEIVEVVKAYKECFYKFYLEIQPGAFEEQINLNILLAELSKDTDTPLIITNDVHYEKQENYKIHDLHVKMSRKMKHNDEMIYPDSCYFLMDYDTISNLFPYLDKDVVEEAIQNTIEVSDMVEEYDITSKTIFMPKNKLPLRFTESAYLKHIAYKKFQEFIKGNPLLDIKKYKERMDYELTTLEEVKFSGYFLLIKDIYDFINDNKIPHGPGRGSVNGSLVAFIIGITEVDPIKYDLIFERFISKYRKGSVPDIDLDISSARRGEVVDYIVNKYGEDHTAFVSTFTIRKSRGALRDTARLYDIPLKEVDRIAKLIPTEFYSDLDGEKETDVPLKEAVTRVPELKSAKRRYREWFNAAEKLEGLASSTSIHAAGIIISSKPIADYLPVIKDSETGRIATSFNLKHSEECGAIKIDLLGLRASDTIDAAEKSANIKIDIHNEKVLQDKNTWKLLGTDKTTTLFQTGSKTYRSRMPRLHVTTIEELAACLALIRGPCISNKTDELYMRIKEGKAKVEKIHPFYDEATKNTLGVLLYQEDLMKILENFGFSTEDAFRIMKFTSKKDKQEEIKKYHAEYEKLARENNVPSNVADRIWHIILDMSKYSFNKSHAIAYALICFKTAYLKANHLLEWLSNSISYTYMSGDKNKNEILSEVMSEINENNVKIKPLDINNSNWMFDIEDDSIRMGFVGLKGVGKSAFKSIDEVRPINDIQDLAKKVSKTPATACIYSGACDSISNKKTRKSIYTEFLDARKEKNRKDTVWICNGTTFKPNISNAQVEEMLFTIPLLNNPGTGLREFDFKSLGNNSTATIEAIIKKVTPIKDKHNREMGFIELTTSSGKFKAVSFFSTWDKFKNLKINEVVNVVAEKKDNSLILKKVAA